MGERRDHDTGHGSNRGVGRGVGHDVDDHEFGHHFGGGYDHGVADCHEVRRHPGVARPSGRDPIWGSDAVAAAAEDDPATPEGGDGDSGGGVAVPRFLAPIEDLRFARQSPKTTTDKIAYAMYGAYSVSDGGWRTANVIFAYTIAAPGHILCDTIKWAFFDRLSRTLLAIPVLIALLFALNHMPLVAWLVPDQWDISTLFTHDAPDGPGAQDVVEVPIVAPPAGGVG